MVAVLDVWLVAGRAALVTPCSAPSCASPGPRAASLLGAGQGSLLGARQLPGRATSTKGTQPRPGQSSGEPAGWPGRGPRYTGPGSWAACCCLLAAARQHPNSSLLSERTLQNLEDKWKFAQQSEYFWIGSNIDRQSSNLHLHGNKDKKNELKMENLVASLYSVMWVRRYTYAWLAIVIGF